MESKTQKAIRLFKQADFKKAYAIFKTFNRQFTEEEQRAIQITAECLTGHSSFYTQLKIDLKEQYEIAERAIKEKIIKTK